ncbi:MAG TPA: ferredoxin reductase [Candidatus Binatia bacterium]|nr:ferredoxin reductase [Candidatus Binatia bacterium]
MPTPLTWQVATVGEIRPETTEVKTFTLRLPAWRAHRAGQHYDVRLTAEDGYQTQRSYSIASPPTRTGVVDLTIERIADGEVSPYFHDVLVPGDQVEVRGPIGGYFVWEPDYGGPLLLIAGGSGVVPLMAMLRERAAAKADIPTTLLASWRTIDDVIYRAELDALDAAGDGLRVVHTLTRAQPPGWAGYARRIDGPMLAEVRAPLETDPLVYICGPTLLVEVAATGLVEGGVPAARVRTERFGPTG